MLTPAPQAKNGLFGQSRNNYLILKICTDISSFPYLRSGRLPAPIAPHKLIRKIKTYRTSIARKIRNNPRQGRALSSQRQLQIAELPFVDISIAFDPADIVGFDFQSAFASGRLANVIIRQNSIEFLL